MPTTATAAPPIQHALCTTRVVLRVPGVLHKRARLIARAHGYADLEDYVLDLVTDAHNAHSDCPQCRRVRRGARPPRRPWE